jgi:tetratricopeptide (TPR) repeat protein
MHVLRIVPFCTVVLMSSGIARAQQVGERWVVKIEKAEVQLTKTTSSLIPQGTILTVSDSSAKTDSLNVIYDSGGKTTAGSIPSTDATKLEAALEFFHKELKTKRSFAGYISRGIVWRETDEYKNALKDLEEALRLDPQAASAYYNRGLTWFLEGEYDNAISDFGMAISIDPNNSAPYLIARGDARDRKGEYDAAIDDYTDAIRQEPESVLAFLGRSHVRVEKGDYERAYDDYRRGAYGTAKKHRLLSADEYRKAAWFRATCPDAKFRSGPDAFLFAREALKLYGQPAPAGAQPDVPRLDPRAAVFWDTLAAAYAEKQNFDEARRCEDDEVLIRSPKNKAFEARRLLYKSHNAYREPRAPGYH